MAGHVQVQGPKLDLTAMARSHEIISQQHKVVGTELFKHSCL